MKFDIGNLNNLSDEEKDKFTETVLGELKDFGNEVNKLLAKTSGGDCPQILKLCLMKKVIDVNYEGNKKVNPDQLKESYKVIDELLGNMAIEKITVKKEGVEFEHFDSVKDLEDTLE